MPGNIPNYNQSQVVGDEFLDDGAGDAGPESKKVFIETFNRHSDDACPALRGRADQFYRVALIVDPRSIRRYHEHTFKVP